MLGLILSGGAGTRLRPLTNTIAKQLLPIANKPILHYAIEEMVRVGISEIGIILGHTGLQVRESVGDGSIFGAKVTYIDQGAPLGLAHCVLLARDFLNEENFLMFLGDNMFEFGLATFIQSFESNLALTSNFAAQVAVFEVDNPSQFGVAEVAPSQQVLKVVEKPVIPSTNLALVGTYGFTSKIFGAIQKIAPSNRGELEITDAIQQLIEDEFDVRASSVNGWWMDTGNPDSYLECNKRVLNDELRNTPLKSHKGNGTVIQPSTIGDNVFIEDAIVGPYVSLSDGVQVVGVDIKDSIILAGTRIAGGGSIHHSIIGKNCVLEFSDKKSSHSLVLGDDCSLLGERN